MRPNARLRRALPARPAPLASIALLALLVVSMGAMLSSCTRQRIISTQQPLTLSNVPTIRVRLTNGPVDSAILSSTGGYRLRVDGRAVSESTGPMPRTTVVRGGGAWRFNTLTVSGGDVVIESIDGLLRFGDVSYRGYLRLWPADERQFLVVNHVDLESYLAGVLSKELYPSWSPATYRALAVAARTFALYHMKTYGPTRDFDVGDDESAQVYGGVPAETNKSWQAVRDTHGQVLTYGPRGGERIFMAQYSASCGGVVNSASVIRDAPDIPPLRGGQRCDDCRRCPRYRWETVRIPKADIYRAAARVYPAIAALGGMTTIRPYSTTTYGRTVWIEMVGPSGKVVRMRAEDLRLVINRVSPPQRQLNSMNCRIVDVGNAVEFADGCGFGHGVGLCQWGAQGKAESGWRWDEMLLFYYPGSTILAAY